MATRKALEGIRALDLGQVWAGPLLGTMFGDHGAEVIKVLTAKRTWGAMMKGATAMMGGGPDVQAFQTFDRNKLGVSLNLQTDEGRELFLRLVEQSDIVFENFHPSVMPRLGLGYEDLARRNPRIILASLSASGATEGPWRDLVTYGPSLAALYGLKSLLGYHGESKILEDAADLDPTAAAHAFVAILAALEYRERSGRGQFIDMAQGEAAMCRMGEAIMDYTMNGRVAGPQGNRYAGFAPHGIYRAAGDDAWVSIVVGDDAEWRAFAGAIGSPAWALDPRFADGYGRAKHQDELDAHVEQWTSERTPAEATATLQARGVAAFPVFSSAEILADPNDEALRQNIVVEHPALDRTQMLSGAPWKYSRTPMSVRMPTPELGEHNEQVLGGLLGIAPGEIARLIEAGVVA